jgi:phage terminase large subunit GpA-like protein
MAFDGLADAFRLVHEAVAKASEPPLNIPVDEWAEQYRFVAAESGSARPGRWSNKTTPYAVEPMRSASPDSPSRRVAIRASAQTLKSELILNAIMHRIDCRPRPMMLVLPSLKDVDTWNRTKWRPNVKACPTIDAKVVPERSRDEAASTTVFKQFVGGYLIAATASSSKELQAKTVADLFFDEVSEFPVDTKGRGDPITQARARQHAWGEEAREIACSTPRDLPDCRISKMVEAGDLRRYYVPCPECGHFQQLTFDALDTDAQQPTMTCLAHGCVIDEAHKHAMLMRGVWIKTYVDDDPQNPPPPLHMPPEDVERWSARDGKGRYHTFDIWQGYSTLRGWASIAQDWREAQSDLLKLKTFFQQVLARPYEGSGEAPDYEKIHLRRDQRPMGVVPFGYWVLTGACDVQGDRLEYGIYAWGPGGGSALVKAGIIPGDPTREGDDCWRKLADIRAQTFEGENGFQFAIDAFGVDAGFASYNVYRFCNSRPATLALDGRGDRFMPALGMPKKIKAAPAKPGKTARPAAMLYPVGAYALKQRLYQALSATIEGPDADGRWSPGAVRLPEETTLDYVKQMTAETLMPIKGARGQEDLQWVKMPGRPNEALDIWVYARACATHAGIDRLKDTEWEAIAAQRGGAGGDAPLERMWSAMPKPAPRTKRAMPVRQRGSRGKIN